MTHKNDCSDLLERLKKLYDVAAYNDPQTILVDIVPFIDSRLSLLQIDELNKNNINCIIFRDNNIYINDAIIKFSSDRNMTIGKYINYGKYSFVFINNDNKYIIKFIKYTTSLSSKNEIECMISIKNKIIETRNYIPNYVYIIWYII